MDTVLLLDPSDEWARMVRARIEPGCELIWAQSTSRAKELIQSRPPIAVIALGWMEGKATTEFLAWLGSIGYKGALIAATPDVHVNKILYAAGCAKYVYDKSNLPQALRDVLEGG